MRRRPTMRSGRPARRGCARTWRTVGAAIELDERSRGAVGDRAAEGAALSRWRVDERMGSPEQPATIPCTRIRRRTCSCCCTGWASHCRQLLRVARRRPRHRSCMLTCWVILSRRATPAVPALSDAARRRCRTAAPWREGWANVTAGRRGCGGRPEGAPAQPSSRRAGLPLLELIRPGPQGRRGRPETVRLRLECRLHHRGGGRAPRLSRGPSPAWPPERDARWPIPPPTADRTPSAGRRPGSRRAPPLRPAR